MIKWNTILKRIIHSKYIIILRNSNTFFLIFIKVL
jgi:hypothetical protein